MFMYVNMHPNNLYVQVPRRDGFSCIYFRENVLLAKPVPKTPYYIFAQFPALSLPARTHTHFWPTSLVPCQLFVFFSLPLSLYAMHDFLESPHTTCTPCFMFYLIKYFFWNWKLKPWLFPHFHSLSLPLMKHSESKPHGMSSHLFD